MVGGAGSEAFGQGHLVDGRTVAFDEPMLHLVGQRARKVNPEPAHAAFVDVGQEIGRRRLERVVGQPMVAHHHLQATLTDPREEIHRAVGTRWVAVFNGVGDELVQRQCHVLRGLARNPLLLRPALQCQQRGAHGRQVNGQ